MHGVYGTSDADLEVQGTIKRAELTAFFCLFRRTVGPTTAHVDNKGTIDGLWRGEKECRGPKSKVADLIHQEGIILEVEHVKAHRSEKEKQEM